MAKLKEFTVSFPARYAAQAYLNRPRAGLNADAINQGLQFYRALNLQFVRKWARDHMRIDPVTGETTLDLSDILEAEAEGEAIKPVRVRMDQDYLVWLRDTLKTHNWNEFVTRDGRTVTVSVSMELQECIGQLLDALDEAISAKEEKEE